MIKKKRTVSGLIIKLEALVRRMPEMEPGREMAISQLNKRRAGYTGEQKLDYYLNFLDEKEYWIYHGLRLSNENQFFQIDTLLLTNGFAIILEVKNWNGTIIFDPEFHQVIRIHNEKEEAFHDPISQAEHQSRQLKKWMAAHGFPEIPVEFAVVISSPSTIIKSSSKHTSKKVVHAHRLLSKLNSIKKSYLIERLTEKQLKKINQTLLKKHVEQEIDVMKFIKVNPEAILTGVHCPKCCSLPMIYHWGKWHCPACKSISSNAYHQAVQDYFLLIKPVITSKEFREFTHVGSLNSATRLLSSMGLLQKGERSQRVYLKM
ncbi:NERD domain-containing protein [Cytobacillus firmus]|uniref:nuclease-related domain-containing protein n=1 Tax=Cytobacillus firmus TaxID=1399 RepID=UPI001C967BB4|nr:nuclease-related domain-containing protein [Cytobacillus firmus]MBY6053336.1 NERD domain-containing protein [Cytobacillus firmus]USK41249.1 NERD domain-containing protein [Cytobacillus firmus]